MIVLGIDSSTTATGWSIIDYDENTQEMKSLISSGVICPDHNLEYIHRVKYIYEQVNNIITTYLPALILIEEMSVMRNLKVIRMLSGLLTVLELLACNHNILCMTVVPSQWRSNCGFPRAKRAEYKAMALDFVKEHFGMSDTKAVSEDEAEAICIAMYVKKLAINTTKKYKKISKSLDK